MGVAKWLLQGGVLRRDPRRFLLGLMPRGSICAEIGVYKGAFSAKILRTIRPRILHLIDPWKYEEDPVYVNAWYGGAKGKHQSHMDEVYAEVRRRFKRQIDAGKVCIHRCSSVEASKRFDDGCFDWIYIDGNHLYEFVKQDLESFFPKIKRGGFITGDDYGVEGWWKGGVTRAVDEFVVTGWCEKVMVKNTQFILRRL